MRNRDGAATSDQRVTGTEAPVGVLHDGLDYNYRAESWSIPLQQMCQTEVWEVKPVEQHWTALIEPSRSVPLQLK